VDVCNSLFLLGLLLDWAWLGWVGNVGLGCVDGYVGWMEREVVFRERNIYRFTLPSLLSRLLAWYLGCLIRLICGRC
jgi:hypothetical protein